MSERHFGKNYSPSGDLSSDYLIKTRGDVTVQAGRKFIKLISGGKINVDVDFINKVDSLDDINGGDGIYYTEDSNIYIKVGDNILSLTSDNNEGEFVSYINLQNVKKFNTVQKNIGLIRDNVNDIVLSDLPKEGLMFDYLTKSFYYIDNGSVVRIVGDIPELINHNIKIDGTNKLGALALLGFGKDKGFSIADNLYIYVSDGTSNISSNSDIQITVNGNDILKVTNDSVIIEDGNKLISNIIESNHGNFRLEDNGNESTLYVDNIVTKTNKVTYKELIDLAIRKKLIADKEYIISDFQNEWEIQNEGLDDFIFYNHIYATDEDNNIIYLDKDKKYPKIDYYENIREVLLKAKDVNVLSKEATYIKDGYSVIYDYRPKDYNGNIINIETLTSDELDELEIDFTYKGRILKLTDNYNNTLNYDFKNLRFYNKEEDIFQFTFNSKYNTDESLKGNIINNTINLKNPKISKVIYEGTEEADVYIIKEIIDLTNPDESQHLIFNKDLNNTVFAEILDNNIFNNKFEFVDFNTLKNAKFEDDLKYVSFHGVIENIEFKKLNYPLLYDNTKKKDVYRNGDFYNVIFIPDLIIPHGLISMWYKGEIPEGWVICDGNNGTPNLIDKFIKGSTVAGNEGGSNSVTLTESNLPSHTHKANVTLEKSEGGQSKHKHEYNVANKTSSTLFNNQLPITFNVDDDVKFETEEIEVGNDGAITDVSVEILSTGEGKAFKIDPQYYTMIYIMKV